MVVSDRGADSGPLSVETKSLGQMLVNAREASRLLSISARTLWSLSASGEMPSVRIRKRRLYDPADLRQFIDRQKTADASALAV